MSAKTICIYHGNCADGFAAAWVVWKWHMGCCLDLDLHAGVYQDPPPDVTDKNVILVDFSYKMGTLLQMANAANSLLIIDHHKTAIAEIEMLPDWVHHQTGGNVATYLDVNHSGAMLAWKYYFTNDEPPKLLEHIEDRDLWRFNLPRTREIQAALFSYPYDLQLWDDLMGQPVENLVRDGMAIERKHFKDIEELIKVTKIRMHMAGYDVPAANLPYTMSSDAGHIMGKGEPFAACYYFTPGGVVFSLRSADDGVDVAEVAAKFGGGGHKHAAGFRLAYDDERLGSILPKV